MNYYKALKKEYKFAFFISMLLLLCTAATSYYADLRSLSVWSLNIWDNLYFTGNPLAFYEFSAQNINNAPHATVGSDISIYFPWAIWNLPMWILHRFFNLPIMEHPFMLFYSKCFLLVLNAGCAVMIQKIGKLFSATTEQISCSIFLFLTGFFTLVSTAYIGQNDILVIFVFLIGIYSLLTGKWKSFLFWSALSIAFKPYCVFPFIALVLLKEKRIHYIALYGLSGMSIYLLQKVPFLNEQAYIDSVANGPTKLIIHMFFENVINLTPHMVSVFVVSLLSVYVLAYFDDGGESFNQKAIYYSTLTYICFFLFIRYESYRPLYLFTFMTLMMLLKPAYYRINLLIEVVTTACLMYYYLYNGSCFFDGLYLELPFAHESVISLSAFAKSIMPTAYNYLCMSVMLLALVIFAVINHPKFNLQTKALTMKEEPYIIVLRSCLFAVPYLAAVVLRYI